MDFLFDPQTIRLEAESAQQCGLIKDELQWGDSGILYRPFEISQDKGEVVIKAEIGNDKKGITQEEIKYDIESLEYHEALILGWSYLLQDGSSASEDNTQKANQHLTECIKEDKGRDNKISWVPYYLIAKNNLDTNLIHDLDFHLRQIVKDFHDLPPYFFSTVLDREDHPIRTQHILDDALRVHPHNESLMTRKLNVLIKQDLNEASQFVNKTKEELNQKEWEERRFFRVRAIDMLFRKRDYESIIDEVETPIEITSGSEYTVNYSPLFKGMAHYHKNNLPKALKKLSKSVTQDMKGGNISSLANYYLIGVYIKLGNTSRLRELLTSFDPEPEMALLTARFSYENLAISLLNSILQDVKELDNDLVAQLKALQAYTIKEARDSRSQNELITASNLVDDAIEYNPMNHNYHRLKSDILFWLEDYDSAMQEKIYTVALTPLDEYEFVEATLAKTSDKYIESYSENVKEIFNEVNAPISKYIRNELAHDIDSLWAKKKYRIIKEVYYLVKDNVDDYSHFESKNPFRGSGLFEVAYSLNHQGNAQQAKIIYEKICKNDAKNSAVLNNMGVIYRKEGNESKAKKLFKEALEHDPENKKAKQNLKKGAETQKQEQDKNGENTVEINGNKRSLKFNTRTGDFELDDTAGNLTPGSQPFDLLKALMESPKQQAEYKNLISAVWKNKEDSKVARNSLRKVLGNLKEEMNILPEDTAVNKNIFKNLERYGYRIELDN
jgi:tetratricopeptide (TPR) repeat protein